MGKGYDRKIILEDGQEYYGYSFGAVSDKICEIVFNTSMVGYQEILSDPSYTYQAVVMTYPLIGNYGMADEDYESECPSMGALIVREYNDIPSNFRSTHTLSQVMKAYDISGISGVDTRKLGRSIRDLGSRRALITSPEITKEEGMEKIAQTAVPHDAVEKVSRKAICSYQAKAAETGEQRLLVAAIDCGMKQNIVRSLNQRGCDVVVVPWNTPASVIEQMHPDGVFISNGPGDPQDVPETIKTVKALVGKYPVFGICLGHQILALAYGARTYKLKFGHRGGNHPVMDLSTGKIEITSQNHSYAVEEASLARTCLSISHRNLLDQTVEGICSEKDHAFSVQYHPESAPGPQDSGHLFERFIKEMKEFGRNQ